MNQSHRGTKQRIEEMVKRLGLITKQQLELTAYKPGDKWLFQVHILNEKKQVMRTLPHWTHLPAKEMDAYLDGAIDGIYLYADLFKFQEEQKDGS